MIYTVFGRWLMVRVGVMAWHGMAFNTRAGHFLNKFNQRPVGDLQERLQDAAPHLSVSLASACAALLMRALPGAAASCGSVMLPKFRFSPA